MPNLLNTCRDCYQITLNACVLLIQVKAGLLPNASYFYRITDKFNNVYTKEVTTTVAGAFTIDTKDLPNGLFTPSSGSFKLEVFKSIDSCDAQELTFCDTETTYTCVLIDFVSMSGEGLDDQSIPCNCDDTPPPVAKSIVITGHDTPCPGTSISFTTEGFADGDKGELQYLDGEAWVTIEEIAPFDLFNPAILNLVIPTGQYQLRIVYDEQTSSNEINIDVQCGEEQSITINNTQVECGSHVDVSYSVVGITGFAEFQAFVSGVWQTVGTVDTSITPFVIPDIPENGTYQIRIKQNDVISNVFDMVINCPLQFGITNFQLSQEGCTANQQTMHIAFDVANGSGSYALWYFDGANWVGGYNIGYDTATGHIEYSTYFGAPVGTFNWRITDAAHLDSPSNEVEVVTTECLPPPTPSITNLVVSQAPCQGTQQRIDIDFDVVGGSGHYYLQWFAAGTWVSPHLEFFGEATNGHVSVTAVHSTATGVQNYRIVDAANGALMSNESSVDLSDCQETLVLSNVSQFCAGNQVLQFDLDIFNGSGQMTIQYNSEVDDVWWDIITIALIDGAHMGLQVIPVLSAGNYSIRVRDFFTGQYSNEITIEVVSC